MHGVSSLKTLMPLNIEINFIGQKVFNLQINILPVLNLETEYGTI